MDRFLVNLNLQLSINYPTKSSDLNSKPLSAPPRTAAATTNIDPGLEDVRFSLTRDSKENEALVSLWKRSSGLSHEIVHALIPDRRSVRPGRGTYRTFPWTFDGGVSAGLSFTLGPAGSEPIEAEKARAVFGP